MWSAKAAESVRVKSWEIIADNLKKAGWSYGYVSAVDREGRTIWIADANRGDGKRFVVRADEILTAFLELERAVWPSRKRALTGLVAARWAALLLRVRPNQSMKPTAPLRCKLSVFATTPCRGLSLSR